MKPKTYTIPPLRIPMALAEWINEQCIAADLITASGDPATAAWLRQLIAREYAKTQEVKDD